MSSPLESGDMDRSAWNSHPFRWILVPILILLVAAAIITCLRYKRRMQYRGYGINASERDLEGQGQNRRPNSRWQWAGADAPQGAGRRRPGFGFGLANREEGLNELGEAPPAYTPSHKRANTEEDVELEDVTRPTPQSSLSQSNLQTLPEARPDVASPPGYDEASQPPWPASPPAAAVGQH
ncbi:uncharacterized protein BCR38DRAFT_409054 [Pseudomassariella vexata]|uniref:Uncharacterized protein n=1 Tax=Pseudomassariella vexata TaxID=1141098 RepID=A0A1Y2E1B1_9PEZI|nr:uncharacterized protein BCR38DRAFT_409054 [Pseudomassariella vexata]ORY65343.1 hypothetical protein BCR38DRAFT_409054 [Pseudomassariella vexata]